jgi:glycosyltransferase involved in cell wall biosynthesis
VSRFRTAVSEPVVEAASVAFNAWEVFALQRAAATFNPDVIYARHARFDVAAPLVGRWRRTPTVLEVNAVYSARPYRDFEPLALGAFAERLERRAFALADVVVAVSTPLARQVHALGRSTVVVLPNGVDPARFDPREADGGRVRERLGLGSRPVIGWSGILRDWHGLDLLLDAVGGIPEAVLLVVGDGPSRTVLEHRAAALGLSGRIVVSGRVSHPEMPDYIAAMDVAVVADERTRVASPMKLVEYMAMERAIVAPRLENITDLVSDGESALLFAPGSARDLGATVARLIHDRGLSLGLGRRARQKVERTLNWRRNADRVEQLVQQCSGRARHMSLRAEA